MTSKLTMVHFQLTLRCNLNCAFCGQTHTAKSSPVDWFALLDELKEYAPGCRIVLWGGEPLLYDRFDEFSRKALACAFPLELITNGTLIDRHVGVLRECFEHIYVSVDGPEAVHDAIRGAGVFAAVKANMGLLRGGKAKLGIMSVLSPETVKFAKEAPYGLPADHVILHELIGFTEEERAHITGADAWPVIPASYPAQLRKAVAELQKHTFSVPVEFQPHFPGGEPCKEPYRHLHVHNDGETGFCTDFTCESIGNVMTMGIREIFEGKYAEKFRERGATPFCAHCSWKISEDKIIRFNCKENKMAKNASVPSINPITSLHTRREKPKAADCID